MARQRKKLKEIKDKVKSMKQKTIGESDKIKSFEETVELIEDLQEMRLAGEIRTRITRYIYKLHTLLVGE